MPSVYVASPYGFSPATRDYYERDLLPAIRGAGWHPHDPWADPDGSVAARFALAEALIGSARKKALTEINRKLGATNEQMIRGSHALLRCWMGPTWTPARPPRLGLRRRSAANGGAAARYPAHRR